MKLRLLNTHVGAYKRRRTCYHQGPRWGRVCERGEWYSHPGVTEPREAEKWAAKLILE